MHHKLLIATLILSIGIVPPPTEATQKKKRPEEKKPAAESKKCDEPNAGQLRFHLDRCQKERDAARHEARQLTDRLTRASHELRVSRENGDKVAKQLAALQANLDAGTNQRRKLEQDLARALQNRDAHTEEIKRLTGELGRHAAKQKQDADALAAARYQIEQAKQELNALVKSRQELEGKLSATASRAEDAERQVAELRETVRQKDALQKGTETQLATTRSALEKARSELQSAAADQKTLAGALAAERSKSDKAEDLIRRLTTSSNATTEELTKAQSKIAHAEGELSKAQAALAASQNKLAATTGAIAKHERASKLATTEIARLNTSLSQLSQSKKQTESELADAKAKLTRALAAAADGAKKLSTATSGEKALAETLAKAETAGAAARAEIERLTKCASAQAEEKKGIKTALTAVHAELVRLKSVLKESGKIHRALDAELAECRANHKSANGEVVRLTEANAALVASHKQTAAELGTNRAELEKSRSLIVKLTAQQKEHRVLETRYRELATRHETALGELKAREAALATASRAISGLERKHEEKDHEIKNLTDELKATQESARRADEKLHALRAELAGIKETLGRVAEIGKTHRELLHRHEALQAECATARNEAEKWREAHRCAAENLEASHAKLAETTAAMSKLESALHESERLRGAAKEKLAACLGQSAESRKALAAVHNELEHSERGRHQLALEHKKLADALTASERDRTKSHQEIKILRERFATVESKIAEGERSRLKTESELVKKSREIANALSAAQELREEVAKRDESISRLTAENHHLRRQVELAQKNAGDRKRLEAELARAKSGLKTATEALSASESKRKATESALSAANHEISQLKANTARSDEAHTLIVSKLTTKLEDVTKLLEICTSKHNSLTAKITQSEKVRTDLTAANRQLAAKLEEALNSMPDEKIVRDLTETRARLLAEVKARKEAEHTVITLKQQMTSLQREASAFREQLVRIDPVYYYINCADIEEQQTRVLTQIREVLHYYPTATFHLVGHTCNIGSSDANLALSKKRASLLGAFITKHGIPARKITAKGVGESHPAADNNSEIGRRLNRHVSIQVDLHIE